MIRKSISLATNSHSYSEVLALNYDQNGNGSSDELSGCAQRTTLAKMIQANTTKAIMITIGMFWKVNISFMGHLYAKY